MDIDLDNVSNFSIPCPPVEESTDEIRINAMKIFKTNNQHGFNHMRKLVIEN